MLRVTVMEFAVQTNDTERFKLVDTTLSHISFHAFNHRFLHHHLIFLLKVHVPNNQASNGMLV